MIKSLLAKKELLLCKHWLVLLASVLLTFFAWKISQQQLQDSRKKQFEFQSEQLLDQLSERMVHYEVALKAGAAAIQSLAYDVDAQQWQSFSETLDLSESYPGVNGIGIIYQVKKDYINTFLTQQQVQRPTFKLHPQHTQSEYWPITFIEPIAPNLKAVGLDIAFETNRLTAAKKARDTGTTQITGPITLVQDNKRTPGFLQYFPFYNSKETTSLALRQKHFVGHVYAPFIMSQLVKGALEQKNRQLSFSIFDGTQILYDEFSDNNENYDKTPLLEKEIDVEMYGRQWTFHIQTARSFIDPSRSNQPNIILAGGIVINVMLFLLFITLSRSQQNALALVKKMTHDLTIKEAYFRNITEAAPCGIIIINQNGEIETVNNQACTLFGYDESEMISKNIELLVPHKYKDEHSHQRQAFNGNISPRRMGMGRDIFGLTKQGTQFPAEIGLAQFSVGAANKTLATIIDMTRYVRVTEELQRSNKELDDFAYVASHDLKAPLRGIMQLGQWIGEDIAEYANEDTKENLSLLMNRTKRLEKLLGDLLDYSRIGRKESDIQEIDTKEMILNIFDLQSPGKNIVLDCQQEMPIIKSPISPFETIVRNLIGNAIKHNDKAEGIIKVECKEYALFYQFSFEDNGPGIEEQYHAKIFELFKTLQPRDEVEGSGMGLAIIKKLLDNHSGSIDVESDGKNGTCFTFTWPKFN